MCYSAALPLDVLLPCPHVSGEMAHVVPLHGQRATPVPRGRPRAAIVSEPGACSPRGAAAYLGDMAVTPAIVAVACHAGGGVLSPLSPPAGTPHTGASCVGGGGGGGCCRRGGGAETRADS